MKKTSVILRAAAAVFACLFTLCAVLGLMVRMCFLDKYKYEDAILTDEFYEEIDKARAKNLDSLGTMLEVEEGVYDKYASQSACHTLGEEYVRALIGDLMTGSNDAAKIKFSSPELLQYLKDDYAGYDFTAAGFKDSDAAAEAAYTMICDSIDTAVLFLPEKISDNLGAVSRLFSLASDISLFFFVPWLLALGLYAAIVFAGGDRKNNLFVAASSVWCAAVLCFVPVLILYLGTDAQYLDFDRNVLYIFINGCIDAVRGYTMFFVSLFFAMASGFLAATGIIATAARQISAPPPVVAEEVPTEGFYGRP